MSAAPGWTYAYSHALQMRYAYRLTPSGPEVMTEDKIRYTPEEVRAILSGPGEITPEIHAAKKALGGVVVPPPGDGSTHPGRC